MDLYYRNRSENSFESPLPFHSLPATRCWHCRSHVKCLVPTFYCLQEREIEGKVFIGHSPISVAECRDYSLSGQLIELYRTVYSPSEPETGAAATLSLLLAVAFVITKGNSLYMGLWASNEPIVNGRSLLWTLPLWILFR